MEGILGNAPTVESRSERLGRTFKEFMDADKRLHEARIRQKEASNSLEFAVSDLHEAENYWANVSEALAQVLMDAAPESVKLRTAQIHAAQYTPMTQAPMVDECSKSAVGTLRSRW